MRQNAEKMGLYHWRPWERLTGLLERWCEMKGRRIEYFWLFGSHGYVLVLLRERRAPSSNEQVGDTP